MDRNPLHFRAHGKLLLTGEYAVMYGVHALALATRYGQHLSAHPYSPSDTLHWKALDVDGRPWLEADFQDDHLVTDRTSPEYKTLHRLLSRAKELNPDFQPLGWKVETRLEFSRHWGLGSSSTLVALIAQWAQCDAFELFFHTLTGSGYDLAVAIQGKPLIYKLQKPSPNILPIDYQLPDPDSIRFIYLGRKQSSHAELQRVEHLDHEPDPGLLNDLDQITMTIARQQDPSDFNYLIEIHEELISRLIGRPTIKYLLFKDYHLPVKSLGAWGGDFVLARIDTTSDEKYFLKKGFSTILTPDQIIA